MRIGLISDIHGNADALTAVMRSARREQVQHFLFCGDLVGYYYEPDRCLEMLNQWDVQAVRGNHEDMLCALLADDRLRPSFSKEFGSALAKAPQLLSSEQLEFLRQLPSTRDIRLENSRVLLCHGSPWSTSEYIYPDTPDPVFQRCIDGAPDYVILGHTHIQFERSFGSTLIINPGSVGQPRRGMATRAYWSILDTAERSVERKAEEYDPSRVIAQTLRFDPDKPRLRAPLRRV